MNESAPQISSDARSAAIADDLDLFDVLDLPNGMQPLQDAYWQAKREWEALDAAYRAVLKDMLPRVEADPYV